MIKFLWKMIFGKCEITVDSANAEILLGIVENNAVPFDSIKQTDNLYTAVLAESDIKHFKIIADKAGMQYEIKRCPGIPLLFQKYKRRPGIVCGIVIFLIMILFSERIIWDFEITGNENIPDTEIIEALENEGCRAGMLSAPFDFAQIQNNCLVDKDSLAWISVNMDGNLARVEVREKRIVPLKYEPVKGSYANIVAAEDGVIEICRVKRGKAVVEVGNVVKKGELLISGVIDVGETGVRYEYADGEVLATVYRKIESFIPFKSSFQTPTGAKKSEIQLKIFGKMINLSPKGSIDYELYGKIIENKKLSLPYDVTLPIRMNKTVYSEMQEETVELTEAEAFKIAKTEAMTELGKMADTVQVLSVSEEYVTEETGVRVTLGVYGVTDISANYGFSAPNDGTDGNGEN